MNSAALSAPIEYLDSEPSASMFETVACLACGAQTATPFISAEDDLTGRPGVFQFVTCDCCGFVYQQRRLTIAHIRSYYEVDYIAHQQTTRWKRLAPLFQRAVGALDRAKLAIVQRHSALGPGSRVLDVGCGSGTFLDHVHRTTGADITGVDLVDLSARPELRHAECHHGLFYNQAIGCDRFDAITMWHFLEHDYDPMRSLTHAREALRPDGRLIVEVPRLDSMSFRMFGHRWPGLQAPQHTALYDRAHLLRIIERSGFELLEYLPYGAFPPYFYLFCGTAFLLLKGRGLNLNRAIYAYFAGQLLLLPIVPLLKHINFAMHTVVCRRRGCR